MMKAYLSLIKFSHTLFALPFAMIGLALGYSQIKHIDWSLLVKVVLCMIFARSAAMAFNRYVDAKYDLLNPRTAGREIPSGVLSKSNVFVFIIISSSAFILTTYFINPICFYLSPVALVVVLGYSYTKRWTFLCHLILGIGLSLAPIGAYLAVLGRFDLIPLVFSAIVLFWVAGFDIIYALQDEQFDTINNLYSIPSVFGKKRALSISKGLHILSAFFVLMVVFLLQKQFSSIGFLSWCAATIFISMLFLQHRLVKLHDLSKINLAFFTTNGIASILFASLIVFDLIW